MRNLHPESEQQSEACPDQAAQKLRRFRRMGGQAPPFALTRRDVALLEDLWRYRALTTGQLEVLRSADAREELRFVSRLPLQRRLQRLYHHEYVNRVARPIASGSLEPVYVLDREGARQIAMLHGDAKTRTTSQLPRDAALDHLLAVNQFRLSLEVAGSRQIGLEPVTWKAGADVAFTVQLSERGERRERARFIPDGYCVLRTPRGRFPYFVEVDRATETANVIARKCQGYYEYWRSGGFASDFGVTIQVGFRVLFVAPTEKRSETILAAVRGLTAGQSMYWVTEQPHIIPERIGQRIFVAPDQTECLSLMI
jgi:hypothetical protein